MMTPEQRKFIQDEIKKQLNIILNAAAGGNDEQTETIQTLFPGMPDITKRPVMHPYGLASRAPSGTISVVGKVGADFQNRMVLGHRAADRPTDIETGEVVLYNADGQAVYIRSGKIQIGTKSSASPLVLGDVLLNALTDIMNAFLNAAQVGQSAVGPVVLDPTVREALIEAMQTYVTEASTNVVSQLVFSERGGST